jgi:hypothetical protein
MNRTSRYISYFSAIASIVVLGYLLRRAGLTSVARAIRLMGASFLVLLLLSGIRHGLRTIAWRCCVDPAARPQRFLNMFALRLMGESVTDLSPAGPFLGESVKIWGLSKDISAKFGVTSVLIEDLLYSLGTGLFVFAGFLLLLFSAARHYSLSNVGAVVALVGLTAIVLMKVLRKSHLPGTISKRIQDTSRAKAFIFRFGQVVRSWEAGIREFLQTRKKLLLAVLFLEVVVNAVSLGETYLILKGATTHASFLDAYMVESANRCAQLLASFVPFGLGVDEGTTTATLHSLGRTLSEGVSVAAIRKLRSLFWDFLGLGLAAYFMIGRRAAAPRTFPTTAQMEISSLTPKLAPTERIP